MPTRDQTVRFTFKALSELPTVIDQLEAINKLVDQQGKIANSTADVVKSANIQQRNDTKATAEENLAITKEIAKQMTLARKAELEQQTAQLKAIEAQNTAYVKAAAEEELIIAKKLSEQLVAERRAELEKELIALQASKDQETAQLKAAHAEQLAEVRAALLEQAATAERLHQEMLVDLKAKLEQQTIATKAEADQQTAIIRGEQQRQTLAMREELAEQRALIKNQGSAFQELRSYITAAFGVYEVVQFGKDIIEAKSKVDQFRAGITQMIGSKKEADEVFEKLLIMAKTTPFEVENLMAATFQIKAMGTATQDLLPTLEVLGNMSAVVGGEKLGLIAKAFTDVQNKGKLMKQELNQFAENGVPLYDLLATSMHKTRDEVVAMAEAHTISFADVKKAIFDASSEGGRYYNMMGIQAQTLGGQVSNLADKFFLAKAKLGDYFDNGLQKVIKGLDGMLDVMAGSNSAIDRNISIINALISAYTTYQVVINAATLKTEALAAYHALETAAVAAKNIAYGAYLLVMQEVTLSQNVMTASQTAATTAARGAWAVLSANPLAAIAVAIGVVSTAYYAWKAATVEVTTAMGEQELALKTEKSNLNTLAQSALSAATGTKERKAAIDLLISKYPQYFAGIDSEKVSNNDLRKILDSVNGSYMTRISLARQAYNLEGLAEKQKELFQAEKAFFDKLPKEFTVQFNGDITKFVAALDKGGKASDELKAKLNDFAPGGAEFFGGVAHNAAEKFKAVGADYDRLSQNMKDSDTARINAAVAAENARWTTQLKTLKKGTDDYKDAEEKHLDELAKINGTYRVKEEKAVTDHTGKMKNLILNSANAIKVIQIQADEESYLNKIKLIQAEEKLEIESLNKIRISNKTSADEITRLRTEALDKIQQAHIKAEANMQAVRQETFNEVMASLKDWVGSEQEAAGAIAAAEKLAAVQKIESDKEVAKQTKKTTADRIKSEKELQAEKDTTRRMEEAAAAAEEKARNKIIGLISNFASQASPLLGSIAKGILSVIDNVDVLSGKSLQASQDRLEQYKKEQKYLEDQQSNGVTGLAKQIEDAKQKVAEARSNTAMAKVEAATAVFQVMGTVYQVLNAIAEAFNSIMPETYKAIAESLGRVREAHKSLYEFIVQKSKETYEMELKNFSGTLDQKLTMIDQYYAREKSYAEGFDRIDAMIAYEQKVAEIRSKAGNDVKGMIQDIINLEKDKAYQIAQSAINEAELQIRKAADVRDAKIEAIDAAYQESKLNIEREIADAEALAETKKQLIQEETDAKITALQSSLTALNEAYDAETAKVKEAYDTQLEALREMESAARAEMQSTYDLKQQLLAQGTNDEIEKIAIIDRERLAALERYRADQQSQLLATRDRILATLTDEGERAQVTAAFEEKLRNLHQEVEDAKLDKTKGISLATTQLRTEEKEKTEQLKQEEKDALANLDDEYQAKFKELAAERDEKLKEMKADAVEREKELKAEILEIETESKNKIKELEQQLKDKVTGLQGQMKAQETSAAYDKKVVNAEYVNAVIEMNRVMFEAEKAMRIADLQSEIAVLNSKKNVFNEGRIIDAVGVIEGQIAVINGIRYNTGGVSPGTAPIDSDRWMRDMALRYEVVDIYGNSGGGRSFTDKDGNKMDITYSPDGHGLLAYENGHPLELFFARGFVAATGKYYATGTDYVEGAGYPTGIDTVPAWLTAGERVMTVEQNQQLNGITNDELVRRAQLFDVLSNSLPNFSDVWADISSAKIGLPAGLLAPDNRTPLDLSKITDGLETSLRKALSDQPRLHINMNERGFQKYLQSGQGIVNYHSNLLNR